MPLVSGVCRTASAPMLSHGGSRLNASKPEANPKTRYPLQHPNFSTPFVFRRGFVIPKVKLTVGNLVNRKTLSTWKGNDPLATSGILKTILDRIASQTIAACAASVAQSRFMITRTYNSFDLHTRTVSPTSATDDSIPKRRG